MWIRAVSAVSRAAALALAALAAMTAVAASACAGADGGTGSGGFFRQYEYEEEVYLSLDGRATVYVHASLAALNALRGTSFGTAPNAPLDREAVRAFYSTPVTRVNGQINASRRANRRFVHVKLDVDDIRRLGEAAPFAWSTYELKRDGDLYLFRQMIGPAADKNAAAIGWSGREVVAFRLHLPSKIEYHNTEREVGRGNILTWEQPLTERLRGTALSLDARMEPQSILYRTLWLFGWTFVAVAISFLVVIWWVRRQAPAEKRAA
ncbi:MAG TPA: hypothetical protein VGJ39_14275 [Vicinamibacterales bacterium]